MASSTSFQSGASATTTTKPTAATTTHLAALTTPFVQQGSCASLWTTISSWSGTTLVASNTADARFADCQPTGWDNNNNGFSFSPAVCPSDWTYFDMATAYSSTTFSVAWCCAGGFSLVFDRMGDLSAPCRRTMTDNINTDTNTMFLHEAWAVSWAASDTATLKPQLPTLTNSMVVPSWTPGEVIPPGKYDHVSPEEHSIALGQLASGIMAFVEIGVPLIVVAIAAGVFACCYRRRRRRQRQRREEAAALMDIKPDKKDEAEVVS